MILIKSTLMILFYCLINLFNCDEYDHKNNFEELCFRETFKSQCSGNEVLIVNKARYGRMKVGKCLTEKELEAFGAQSQDPRYYGCYNDVATIINERCALKINCEMKIIDLDSADNSACLQGLRMYLEIDYSCLPVVENIDMCQIFATSRPKYLNPKSLLSGDCASRTKALKIEAPKGQRIKISLEIFSINKNMDDGQIGFHRCDVEIGLILDPSNNKNTTVCKNGFKFQISQQNLDNSVISHGNLLGLNFYPEGIKHLLLIKVEAEGCLDIIPPEDTWLKRNGDDIVIGCYSSKQTWYLRCENKKWVGAIGNCSSHDLVVGEGTMNHNSNVIKNKIDVSESHQILIIIAICGFGVVICLVIICLGALCVRRYGGKTGKNLLSRNFIPEYQCNGLQAQPNTLTNHQKYPDQLFASTYSAQQRQMYGGSLGDRVDDERYQVLDKDEVAKENASFL